MKIAVYGATGFTGGFAVAELHRRGIDLALAGRDGARLRAVADGLGISTPDIRVAGLGDADALAAAFAGCAAVVNAAGPFDRWGEPVVRAALAAGCHYVDTSGEQRHIHRTFERFGPEAAAAGVTIVPAMTDDGGPGDLIAALTAARLPAVDELTVADLRLTGGISRGTARSMAGAADEPALDYRDGAWHPADDVPPRSLAVPGEPDAVRVTGFALPGVVTVPRHVRARRVRGAIRAEVADLLTAVTPEVVETIPATVDEENRAARWLMLAEAGAPDGTRARGWVTGTDCYRLTGVIAVEAARRLAAGDAPPGALAPAQAFDPADFLDFLTAEDVVWRLETLAV
ncbi:trans-acting enoyl reductase family protein [Nocardia sp. BMG51109]|uniref:saccharopine dehydrogenase family protein n=1 Tax=Nocardia sp. BMG51109 TaxID=1056816 RepID=UPI000464838C|nr:saccharopine dehydrogenase NADP-binding domain-containing protein [Nocardia sp. BMG51109]